MTSLRAGAEKVQGDPGIFFFCTRKKGNVQRKIGICQKDIETSMRELLLVKWIDLNIKKI
jgi:hypothetical protein